MTDGISRAERIAFAVLRCAAAAVAFWATQRHPMAFYTLTRWLVLLTCLFGAYLCRARFWQSFGPVFVALAVVFNPIAPLHLTRAHWHWLDIAAGVLLLASLAFKPGRIGA